MDINKREGNLLDYLIMEDLVMLNKGAKPSYATSIRSEVLQMIICNELIKRWIQDWRGSDTPSVFDHKFVRSTMRGLDGQVVGMR